VNEIFLILKVQSHIQYSVSLVKLYLLNFLLYR